MCMWCKVKNAATHLKILFRLNELMYRWWLKWSLYLILPCSGWAPVWRGQHASNSPQCLRICEEVRRAQNAGGCWAAASCKYKRQFYWTLNCVNADQCFVIYQNVYSHRLSFIGNEEGLARCTAQERLRGLDSWRLQAASQRLWRSQCPDAY